MLPGQTVADTGSEQVLGKGVSADRPYLSLKPQSPMEHSGARNCSLKEDMEATLYILDRRGGHENPKDVKLEEE